MDERGFSGSEIRWLACYFASSWLTNFGHGLVVTVVGPTQLYVSLLSVYNNYYWGTQIIHKKNQNKLTSIKFQIAQNVDVAKDTINLLWTFGFLGYLVGSFATGFVFKE